MDPYRNTRIALPYTQWKRQAEKALPLVLVLPMKWISPWMTLFFVLLLLAYYAFVSPRLLPDTIKPQEHQLGYPLGKISYAGMLAVLLVLFRGKPFIVAGSWALMALADPAATLAGSAIRSPSIPWNREKTVLGTAAFFAVGLLGSLAMIMWINYPPDPFPLWLGFRLSLGAALIGAAVETLPLPVDDNISVPTASTIFLALYIHPFLLQANHEIW